jgi:hypothetical protein
MTQIDCDAEGRQLVVHGLAKTNRQTLNRDRSYSCRNRGEAHPCSARGHADARAGHHTKRYSGDAGARAEVTACFIRLLLSGSTFPILLSLMTCVHSLGAAEVVREESAIADDSFPVRLEVSTVAAFASKVAGRRISNRDLVAFGTIENSTTQTVHLTFRVRGEVSPVQTDSSDPEAPIYSYRTRVAYLSPNEVRPFSIGFGFFYTPGLKAAVLSAARWSIEDLSAEVVSPETVARELNDTALPDFVSASIPSDFSLWGAFGVEGTRSEAEFISGAQLDWSTFGDVGRIDSLALSGIILEPPTHPRNVSEIYRAEWMGVSTQWHPWVWNDSTSDQALLIVWLPPNMRGIRNEGAEAPVIVHALSRPLGMLRVNRF